MYPSWCSSFYPDTLTLLGSVDVDTYEMMEIPEADGNELPCGQSEAGSSMSCLNSQDTQDVGKGDEVETTSNINFYPPVYIQRYGKVREVIQAKLESPEYKHLNPSTGKTVMEVGCAEFGMMKHLKDIMDLGKVIFLDLDKALLVEKEYVLRPLPAEYIRARTETPRPQALVVEAYTGCITTLDEDLYRNNPDIWCVFGIEVIEHLHPNVLRGFVETVFGIISPPIVILTTPNSDFNPVFSLPPGKFRHPDHKFEWSRLEFDMWCKEIVAEFEGYTYSIEGIGKGTDETSHLGCVSQMAVFEKKNCTLSNKTPSQFLPRIQKNAYSLIRRLEYPNYIESRPIEEIILNEMNYYTFYYLFSKSCRNEYEEKNIEEIQVPFSKIQEIGGMPNVVKENPDFLRMVLESANFRVKTINDEFNVIFNVPEFISTNFEDNSCEEDDDAYIENENQRLCDSMEDLDVNRVKVAIEEEVWD